mmetsp:Transcript_77882/g.228344  ORF Transcript_77882/g.228344 Transcript_77882/m.228344 type:complete len:292 (+) Transcript_77882:737-1612(+)
MGSPPWSSPSSCTSTPTTGAATSTSATASRRCRRGCSRGSPCSAPCGAGMPATCAGWMALRTPTVRPGWTTSRWTASATTTGPARPTGSRTSKWKTWTPPTAQEPASQSQRRGSSPVHFPRCLRQLLRRLRRLPLQLLAPLRTLPTASAPGSRTLTPVPTRAEPATLLAGRRILARGASVLAQVRPQARPPRPRQWPWCRPRPGTARRASSSAGARAGRPRPAATRATRAWRRGARGATSAASRTRSLLWRTAAPWTGPHCPCTATGSPGQEPLRHVLQGSACWGRLARRL